MPPTTTSLIAFQAPAVKRDAVVFAMRTTAGHCEISASPALARDLAEALLVALDGSFRPRPAPAVKTGRPGRQGAKIDPARRAAYLRVWAEHRAGLHRSFSAACRAHSVKEPSATNWLNHHHAELDRLCAAEGIRVPVPKPSGGLL